MAPHIGDVHETRLAAKACAGPLFDRLGIQVRKENCGSYGCVYKQRGTGNIVKIVAGRGAEMEYRAATFVIALANAGITHPQLPRFYEVWDLGTCAHDLHNAEIDAEGAFAYVREDIPDARWVNPIGSSTSDPLWMGTHALLEIAYRRSAIALGQGDPVAHEIEIDVQEKILEQALDDLTSHDGELVMRMEPLFTWGYENGIIFQDAHFANWGIRPSDGELVLRDIGLAASSTGPVLVPRGPVHVQMLSDFVVLEGLHKFGGTSWRSAR